MLNQALFKRIIPFIAALVFGLLITSVFINIKPNFDKYKMNRAKWGERHKMKKLKHENWRLKRENQRLTERLEANERIILLDVPPPPPSARVMVVPSDSVPTTK